MGDSRYVLTVTLNPAIDYTVTVKRVEKDKDIRVDSSHVSAGGKGLNVARALACLGVNACVTGFAGGFSGDYVQSALAKEKMVYDFVPCSQPTRLNITMIENSGSIYRAIAPGPRISKMEGSAFVRKYALLLRRSWCVVFSGSIPLGCPESIYARLIRVAHARGVPACLDTSGLALERGVAARPYLVKLNAQEAEYLVHKKITSSLSAMIWALKRIRLMGPDNVVITLGENGAVGFDGYQVVQVVSPKVRVKNTVGSGDSFMAGFVTAGAKRLPFVEQMHYATAVASASVLTEQPGTLHATDLRHIHKKIKLRCLSRVY